MTLIEQAAKRLEQLRQAGVELPEESNSSPVAIKEPAPHPVAESNTRQNQEKPANAAPNFCWR